MRTIRRKIAGAEEAHRLLEELERSGEDPRTFCRRRGLDGRSLHCWRLNLGRQRNPRRSEKPESLRIVEVGWPSVPPAEAETAAPEGSRVRLSVGDVVIEVEDGFSEETLYRLMSVIRAC